MKSPQPTPQESERLEQMVSYLDGELSAEESAGVERQLASDEAFRQELQSIDRAWNALDQLPLATVEDRFAKTTMEMVVQTARDEVDQQTRALPIQKRRRSLKSVSLVVAAALLGSLLFRIVWQNPNRALLADLPVIQNIDVYSQFHEVDFLRQLNPTKKDDFWPLESEGFADEAQQLVLVSAPSTRRSWLKNTTEEERVVLRAKFNRFRSLPEEQQERLRRLHEEIDSAEDAAALRETMLQYQRWLNSLPASEQYELRELAADERVKRVTKLLRQQAAEKSLDLTSEELNVLIQAIKPHLEEKREELLSQMPRDQREHFEALPFEEKPKHLMRRLMRGSRRDAEQLLRLIRDSIPEDKRQAFDKLPAEEKRRQFAVWMWQAAVEGRPRRSRSSRRSAAEISEQELEEYFTEELDAATIESLLALPRDKMRQELERRYLGGIPRENLEEFFDHDFRPPPWRGPPHPGEGRRRGGPRDRPPPEGRRFEGPPPPRPDGLGRERRLPPEDV